MKQMSLSNTALAMKNRYLKINFKKKHYIGQKETWLKMHPIKLRIILPKYDEG